MGSLTKLVHQSFYAILRQKIICILIKSKFLIVKLSTRSLAVHTTPTTLLNMTFGNLSKWLNPRFRLIRIRSAPTAKIMSLMFIFITLLHRDI